jgi:hypothetical protein
MLIFNTRTAGKRRSLLTRAIVRASLLFFASVVITTVLVAQSTSGTGGIRGMVVDQSATPVVGASVSVINKSNGAVLHVTTTSIGIYSSGPLQPGDYVVRVEAKGFKKAELNVITRVSVTTGGDLKLEPGAETETVTKALGETTVNTEQPTVQSILIPTQMDLLPIGGRNFLDLAQFAPNIQLQDGSVFDPSKNGTSSISFVSRYGRAARVEVDGVSISDEIHGGVAQNVAPTAIQEFNLAQSSLDLPVETISSGTVNIATRSGSNALHAEVFGVYHGDQGAAALPGGSGQSFQREQYGARAGGALIKDKLFWFLDGERTQQNLTAAENFAVPFSATGQTLSLPFRDVQGDGRLDWQRRNDARGFYRFTFDQVSQEYPFGPGASFQALRNATHAPSHTLGYDFTRSKYTHSIRFEYLRVHDGIGDDTATIPKGFENPIPGLGINLGAAVSGNCSLSGGGAYCAGPSPLAGQLNLQSNINLRYDGTRVLGSHVFRFGLAYNHIQAGGFAALYANPQAGSNSLCLPGSFVIDCITNPDPTVYPADFVTLGNGLNFSTAKSAFGFPGGGFGPDNQIELYVGDGWRMKPNVTVTYGLRYVRDTGRTDSNLGPMPILNNWLPGLGNRVRQPNTNFGPQLGFAWNVNGSGNTVIRGGAGVYYDTSLFSNLLPDARARSPHGEFAYTPQVCAFGSPAPFLWPTSVAALAVGTPVAGGTAVVSNPVANQVSPTFCGESISTAGSQVLALSSAFQAATASNSSPQANPNYIPTSLSAVNANGVDVFGPDYRTPRSIQMNLGFQHELRPGTVFSVDYVRSLTTHSLLIQDQNNSGSVASYNFQNAFTARNAVEVATGCAVNGTGTLGQAQCVVNALGSVAAAQAAFSAAGLDSNATTTGGAPCSFCAFPGITNFGINRTGNGGGNGALGTLDTLSTIGRSVYSGWQGKLVQRFTNVMQGVRAANVQVAYTYSKFTSQDNDQDFPGVATNNNEPLQFKGPAGLDRKHQITFASTFDLKWGLKLGLVSHFYSPLPQTLRMPELTNGGEIFASDWIGSGLGSGAAPEPLEGTGIGQFMRGTNISNLQHAISVYNTSFAGTLTPAGHCLVADQQCPGTAPLPIFNNSDMAALGWVMPTIPSVAQGAADAPWLKTVDLRLAWPIKVRDRFTIIPSASVFNAFNFANAFLPGDVPNGSLLSGPNPTFVTNGVLAPSVAGGVLKSGLTPFRNGLQSGTFASGAPRQLEFGVKISF